MTKVLTPSEGITAGQIGKFQELLGAALRKSGLKSEPVQRVLQGDGKALVSEIMSVVQKYVDAVSNFITRTVNVNRFRTPQEMLVATDRKQYTDSSIVKTMPTGEGEETEVVFFNLGRYISDDDLEKEYEIRGLKPDPYSQAAVNEADPAFADEHPNSTHWKDADGNWCLLTFRGWREERSVHVGRGSGQWGVRWWFAGVRK
jgi:hypothetical protein